MIISRQIAWQNAEQIFGTNPPFSATIPMSAATATCPCCDITLEKPKLVAYGSDSQTIRNQIAATGLQYATTDPVVREMVGASAPAMLFSEDATFSRNRALPSTFLNPEDIRRDLIETFSLDKSTGARIKRLRNWVSEAMIAARLDDTGFAQRFFHHMLGPVGAPRPLSQVEFHEDHTLNSIAANHIRVRDYCDLTLNAPGQGQSNKIRLHQALEIADWDINKIEPITDLGMPALNNYDKMDKILLNNDMGNGLTLTVHGLQHTAAIVKN